jgi:hypothetical protein
MAVSQNETVNSVKLDAYSHRQCSTDFKAEVNVNLKILVIRTALILLI